jgi:hypothetical protein
VSAAGVTPTRYNDLMTNEQTAPATALASEIVERLRAESRAEADAARPKAPRRFTAVYQAFVSIEWVDGVPQAILVGEDPLDTEFLVAVHVGDLRMDGQSGEFYDETGDLVDADDVTNVGEFDAASVLATADPLLRGLAWKAAGA